LWALLVRIWDIVGEDQALKGEFKVISGKMYAVFSHYTSTSKLSSYLSNDLEWDGESKRIIAVGDGKDK
jgi:WD repeat-containing protein 1 (actin-interacting protein 1)